MAPVLEHELRHLRDEAEPRRAHLRRIDGELTANSRRINGELTATRPRRAARTSGTWSCRCSPQYVSSAIGPHVSPRQYDLCGL